MKLSNLEEEVLKELKDEDVEMAKEVMKERLREIKQTRQILSKLEEKYQDLLTKDLEDVIL